MKKILLLVSLSLTGNVFASSIPGSPSTSSSFSPQIPSGSIQSSFTPYRISSSPINGSLSGIPNLIFNSTTFPSSSF